MLPKGYVVCKEMEWENKDTFIIYFHVLEDSTNFVSVYLTDLNVFLTAKIAEDELRKISSKLGIYNDTEVISCLKSSVKHEALHFDELKLEIRIPINYESKSSELIIRFIAASTTEKEKYLKFLIFQLARIAENKCDSPEPIKTQSASPAKPIIYENRTSLKPNKQASKRQGPGMSIVNPASKRINIKQGVKYEEEDSDS